MGGARAGVARVSEAPPPRRTLAHELRETAGGRGESEPEVPCELASYGTRTPASARLQPRRSNCASRGASELRWTLDCTMTCELREAVGCPNSLRCCHCELTCELREAIACLNCSAMFELRLWDRRLNWESI